MQEFATRQFHTIATLASRRCSRLCEGKFGQSFRGGRAIRRFVTAYV
jgi:hypothetical protein